MYPCKMERNLIKIYFISFQFSMFIFSLYKSVWKKFFFIFYIIKKKYQKQQETSSSLHCYRCSYIIFSLLLFYKNCAIERKWFQNVFIYYYSRVSVIRGQVITPQGLGIIGIRVSVDKDARFGFTLTRSGGW